MLFGPSGAAEGLAVGGLVIDMTTIAPTASRQLADRLGPDGVGFIDAPVTGSAPRAEDATLTIMAGGPPEHFARARPLLEAMGRLVLHVGPQGHGSMIKLLNNTVAAVNAAALAEALTVAESAELDLDALVAVMGAGSGASTMLDLKAAPMRERSFEPLFKLEHMLKDVRHCLAEARALGVGLPLAARAEELYAKAAAGGRGEEDFAAVIEALDK